MSIIEDRTRAELASDNIGFTSDKRATATLPTIAGWFDDPRAQHHLRYFDGSDWTAHVTHFGPTPCSGCG